MKQDQSVLVVERISDFDVSLNVARKSFEKNDLQFYQGNGSEEKVGNQTSPLLFHLEEQLMTYSRPFLFCISTKRSISKQLKTKYLNK